ncbi:MAG: hypothetical protein GXZ11_02225 [Tissierellia bacterium]|nr:hypothetical protein [Tissierellia bacterium]
MKIDTLTEYNIFLTVFPTGTLALELVFRESKEILEESYKKAEDYGLECYYSFSHRDKNFPAVITFSDVFLLEEIIYDHPDCVPDFIINYAPDYRQKPTLKNIKLVNFLKKHFFGKGKKFREVLENHAKWGLLEGIFKRMQRHNIEPEEEKPEEEEPNVDKHMIVAFEDEQGVMSLIEAFSINDGEAERLLVEYIYYRKVG